MNISQLKIDQFDITSQFFQRNKLETAPHAPHSELGLSVEMDATIAMHIIDGARALLDDASADQTEASGDYNLVQMMIGHP